MTDDDDDQLTREEIHRQYGWALTHVGAHLLGSLAATVAGIEAVRWLHA